MDIRKLQAFCKVFEENSFSRAGKKLYLSQPTISAHIASLEEELKVLLFDRVGRNIFSTQAAEILYKRSKEIFDILDLAVAEIGILNDEICGEIHIGGSTIPANYFLPLILAKFYQLYPKVMLKLHVGDSLGIVNMIKNGELTCGVVGSYFDEPELRFLPIIDDQLIIIGPKSLADRLKGKELFRDITKFSWVKREKGSGTQKAFEEAVISSGFRPEEMKTSIEVENTEALVRCVQGGLGLGVTSRLVADEMLKDGRLIEIRVKDLKVRRKFYVVYHGKRNIFPATRKLIQFLDHQVKDIP